MISQKLSGPIRRRNGKQQACEPCRMRKLACDHGFPTCQRCQKRKISQNCVYLQASNAKRPTPIMQPPENMPSTSSSAGDVLDVDIAGEPKYSAQTRQWPLFEITRAWMGPTSFNAVFHENRNQLEQLPSPPTAGTIKVSEIRAEWERRTGGSIDRQIQQGIEVLRHVPDTEELCDILFSRNVNPSDGWIRLLARKVSESLWQTFGALLHDKETESLKIVAQQICQNHVVTVREDSGDADTWINSFSGRNLQWEVLGILFTYWAFGILSSSVDDPIFKQHDGSMRDRREVVRQLKQCASSCIELYGTADGGNSLLVYLMYKRNILDGVLETDAAPIVWRQHGELAALTMSLGLHRAKIFPADEMPSAVSEARKRVFAAVFRMDKGVATYTGRPPLLSRRYTTSSSLPHDVSDEAALAGGETLATAIAALDEHGFNTEGKVYSTTLARARIMLAVVRDEILELAMGGNAEADSVELAGRLKLQSSETYATFPPCIQYDPGALSDKTITGPVLFAKTVTRLEHLESLFILERLLIKHGSGNMQELIDVSCEMLDLTLIWWKHSNRFVGMHSEFEWVVTSYAAPTAGVLCVELLKQMHGNTRQTSRPGLPEHGSPPRYVIPRSQTIQNLTLFVGCLDWIQISEPPSSDICGRIRQIVSRVLDELLNGSPTSDNRTAQLTSVQAADNVALISETALGGCVPNSALFAQNDSFSTTFDFDNTDLWNFDLMDTYGWIEG